VLAAIRFGQCRIGFCGGATALGGFRRSGVRGWVRRKSRRRSGWLGGLHGSGDEVLRAGRFYPIAVFVDSHIETGGTNDHVRGFDGAAVSGLEKAFEDASDLSLASLKKAGVVRVAIDGETIGEVILPSYLLGAAPADEIAFDGIAIGMRADGATARMAGKVGRGGRVGRRWWRGRGGGRLFGERRSGCGGVRCSVGGRQLLSGHAFFFSYFGISFRDRHEFVGGRAEP
jgi:hypothetical protein